MPEIVGLKYRTFDTLLDSVRIDLKSFASAGDIDAAELIKVAQRINYELGIKIHSLKETLLEVDHYRAKLPADFHQMNLALICHQYRAIQMAPWNEHVILEELTSPLPANTTQTSGTSSNNCDICNITHLNGNCPELVINPYPLDKCRSICNDSINIKILQYCEAQVHCYEHFERLHIDPYTQASGFNTQHQFRGGHRGMINGNFLEVPHIECTKVYVNYMGSLEDDNGNLLVLEHPLINNYYTSAIKKTILENLYINGENVIERLKYMENKENEYREKALLVANMPNFRDMINTISVIREEHMRTWWKPLSRAYGRLGWAIPGDNFGII